jgi:predicted metalloprotease with PDZ domain
VYWGGALFCLLADIEIRKQTANAKSLDTAFRAIRDAGGDVTQTWPLEKAIAIGDAATGTHVLRSLYEESAQKPMRVDLEALWKMLGVKVVGETVTFDDAAELAGIRRAIAG